MLAHETMRPGARLRAVDPASGEKGPDRVGHLRGDGTIDHTRDPEDTRTGYLRALIGREHDTSLCRSHGADAMSFARASPTSLSRCRLR